MASSLSAQAAVAAGFIADAWPQAREAAWGLFDRRAPELRELIFCGCGDSHHAAYSLGWITANWTGLPAAGLTAMEAARYRIPRPWPAPDEVLLVAISASGATVRTREAVALAKAARIRSLAVTSISSGPLASEADQAIQIELPGLAPNPGLLSYLGSLLAGMAVAARLAPAELQDALEQSLRQLPAELRTWQVDQDRSAQQLLEQYDPAWPIVFLGSGPAHGSARFAAAKVIEASGQVAWAQDVEEWAHLEYFCEPADLPVWILSGRGASHGREREVSEAARRIGRTLATSEWNPGEGMPGWLRENLAPLVLWAGPVAFADRWMQRMNEQPFRGFGGGRAPTDGGGVSRIRTGERFDSLDELRPYDSRN